MRLFRVLLSLAACVLLPAAVFAQASIAGIVKDSSGAVLPGVTVEAASPALIEKIRTAVTDGTGQYRIENLRPGTYSVTFTLTGFSAIKREGIELTGSFTAPVNVELRVGAVAETVTVTGETPVVDVQNASRQTVLSKDILNAIPTAGSYNAVLVLVPGLFGGQQDISMGPCNSCTFSAHGAILSGGRANSEARLLLDGLSIAVPQAGGTNYLTDTRNSQEVNFTTQGSTAEVESGGPVMNIVPRAGGNSISGNGFASWANDKLQGSNYSQELQAAGLAAPNPLVKIYDFNGAVGGPVRKDQIWFFTTARSQGSSSYIPVFYNKNAGNPNAWLYVPDLSHQAVNDKTWVNGSARLTMQLSPRNKLNLFWDEQNVCSISWAKCENGGNYANALFSPEANGYGDLFPMRAQQATYASPISSKVLVEGGFGYFFSRWGGRAKDNPNTESLIKVVEQCTAGCPANGNIPGLTYRSQTVDLFSDGRNKNVTTTWRASVSFVTGSKSLKIGYQGSLLGDIRSANRGPNDLRYRFNNGAPNQLTMFIHEFQNDLWMRDDALYAQGQWTMNKLTLQGGLRFDRAWSWAPEQTETSRFLPVPLSYPETPGVDSYKDLQPRFAATYDVFGNGKTALKGNIGKYLEATITASNYGIANPTSRIAQNVTRNWTDSNSNFSPDCDLLNPNAQDLRAQGGDVCGAYSNLNFGKNVFSNTIDPAILKGWGVRPSDWAFGIALQQEVLPRVSIEVGYVRRWFQGFIATDNLAVSPSDFGTFNITAPLDSRLPGGGGQVVGPLYDVNPLSPNGQPLFGATNNYITSADNYGTQYQRFNGLDFNATARARNGLTVQGGFSFGKTTADTCEIRAKLPESAPLNPFCHIETGYLPQYKLISNYIIPKIDVQSSVTYTGKAGIQVSGFGTPAGVGGALAANYTVLNAVVQPQLGRPLSGGAPNVTANIVEPGVLYGDRVNEVDLRLGKIFRFGHMRTTVGVDIYNLLNSAAILSYNQAYIAGGAWLGPTSEMSARFAKLSLQFDF
ncbi:MAG TPA: carboxypeptidase-like regulatory domain-containing protein [Vicinamibacterales bacterium]|nr:carboxypeptidase-like regulatory domain-containing protein [Vicinamibacterales bacterium]